jgi:hypothetical protein
MFEKPVLPLGKGELEGVTPFLRGDFSNILLLSLEQTYKLRWRVCHNRLHGKCILPSSYQLARRPPVSCL